MSTNEGGFFIWGSAQHLAQAVITVREAAGMNRLALAAKAKVGRRFLYDLEQGKERLRADKIFAVLVALELVPVLLPAAAIAGVGRQE